MEKKHSFGIAAVLILAIVTIGAILIPDNEPVAEETPAGAGTGVKWHNAVANVAASAIFEVPDLPELPILPPKGLEFYKYVMKPALDHVLVSQTETVLTSLGTYYLTGYTSLECGGSTTTASGTTCHKADSIQDSEQNPTTCAIDPALHDFSDIFYIENFGYYVAEDTGSAVKGKHLDLYFWDDEYNYALSITGYYEVFAVEYNSYMVYATKYDIRGAEDFRLYQGNMLDMLEVIQPNSIDAIVTDPPYELGFMNKGWDNSGIAFQAETWAKCYQVLKHGGYLLAFGGTRTYHRIACAIEDAGFEIRDCIMWLYGSGFPKSMNLGKAVESKLINGSANTQDFRKLKGEMVATGDWGMGKLTKEQGYRPSNYWEDKHLRIDKVDYQTAEGQQWDGWGTALKPAYEPVIVARKPCEGSCVDNVLRYGVGGINIDDCRIGDDLITTNGARKNPMAGDERTGKALGMFQETNALNVEHAGRYPSNVILTYDETDQAEVCGGMPETKSSGGKASMPEMSGGEMGVCNFQTIGAKRIETDYICPMDEGSAARYFYCAKASKRDRDEGLDNLKATADPAKGNGLNRICEFCGAPQLRPELCQCEVKSWILPARKNIHPTVKPTDLMQYLVRLVTPKGGTVLDPFNGSGSTGKACMYENRDRDAGYKYIGIELTEEYLPIADARIRYAAGDNRPIEPEEKPLTGQITFFDLLGGTE